MVEIALSCLSVLSCQKPNFFCEEGWWLGPLNQDSTVQWSLMVVLHEFAQDQLYANDQK
jgi:hypothetical protein